MRVLVPALIAASVALAGQADAERAPDSEDEAAVPADLPETIWDRAAAPHGRVVARILAHAGELYERVSLSRPGRTVYYSPAAIAVVLAEARGMLRHAHSLVPDNTDIIMLLARVDEQDGRLADADSWYARSIELLPAGSRMLPDLCARWGSLAVRRGLREQAVARLERCVADSTPPSYDATSPALQQAMFQLAALYTEAGRVDAAIALFTSNDEHIRDSLMLFILASLYDKDEQHSRTYEAMELLRSRSVSLLWLSEGLAELPFWPPIDRHYLSALLYEQSDLLPDARQEWLNYAAGSEDVRLIRRAREHVAAIDALHQAKQAEGAPARPARPREVP